eukprot:11724161-Karenia_brevis.AAC.1
MWGLGGWEEGIVGRGSRGTRGHRVPANPYPPSVGDAPLPGVGGGGVGGLAQGSGAGASSHY